MLVLGVCALARLSVSMFSTLTGEFDMALTRKVQLYVGTGPSQNGVVTNYYKHLNESTDPVGWTIDDADANPPGDYVEVFAGTNGGVNNKIVSPNDNHRGGSTESIGYLSLHPIHGGTKLYVGIGPNTNGDATNNTHHQGEPTKFFGYTMP